MSVRNQKHKTNLQEWSMWNVKDCYYGPKRFGLTLLVQNFHFVAVLVHFPLKIFKITDLSFTISFPIFLLLE